MDSSPPSQRGRLPLIEVPMAASRMLNSAVATNACLSTERALPNSPAPIWCATCTEKPVAEAVQTPQNSHVEVDTSPMDADASAPRLPTMAASIYCITMYETCARTDGMLSLAVSSSCCRRLICLPSRMRASRASVLSVRDFILDYMFLPIS